MDLAMRTKGKALVLESIRLKAVALFNEGFSKQDIAKELMVSTRSIYRWVSGFQLRGISGVMSKVPLNSSSYLSDNELEILKKLVLKCPKEFGYCSDYWSGLNLSDFIIKKFGIHFHQKYIYRFAKKNGITLKKRNKIK
jgi:transposase